jgi:predicted flavoprotein YhiN
MYFNFSLFIDNETKSFDLAFTKELSDRYVNQRNFALDLIPKLKPEISKTELIELIKSKYPNETINVLDNHIQWRLFSFWFENEKITEVQVGS